MVFIAWLKSKINKLQLSTSERLKYLEDQSKAIAGLNVNAETEVEGSTYSIEHLPKNAAAGPMGAVLKGMTAQNLVTNGDFSDGTTGWAGTDAEISAVSNILAITGGGVTAQPNGYQTLNTPLIAGKKYYTRMIARVTNADCFDMRLIGYGSSVAGTYVNMGIVTSPINGSWYILNGIMEVTNQEGNLNLRLEHRYADAATSLDKVMEVKEVMALDLTALGLEDKTADEINAMFPHWFDGLQSAEPVTVKSVGKNLIGAEMVVGARYTTLTYPYNTSGISSWSLVNGVLTWETTGTFRGVGFKVKVKPGESYVFNATIISLVNPRTSIRFYTKDNVEITPMAHNSSGTLVAFTVPDNTEFIVPVVTSIDVGTFSIRDIQLEPGSTATAYEPYREAEAALPAGLTLRRLPNGVQDEFDLVTGTHTKRIDDDGVTELAEPIITQYPAQNIFSYPSGTVYIKNILADADFYGEGIAIGGLTFTGIAKVTKIDLENGVETDVTDTCTLNGEANGFTSTVLESGDICWYELEIDPTTTVNPELAYSYYDSRYAVVDDNNDKVYGWKIASTDGTPRIELEEI